MIKNGNGIYNSLDKYDISRYLTIWEDITSKVGHLNTSLSNGGVVTALVERVVGAIVDKATKGGKDGSK